MLESTARKSAKKYGATTVFPQGGLDPESAIQTSIGARFGWKPTSSSAGRFVAEVEYFTVDLQDVVLFEGGQRGTPFKSVSNAPGEYTSEGITTSVGWLSERFQSTLTYSQVKLTDPAGDPVTEIRSIAAARGDRLRWSNEVSFSAGLRFGYEIEGVDELTRLPSGVATKDGYVIHNARVDWSMPEASPFSIALVARNLTDKFYIDQTSFTFADFKGIPEPAGYLCLVQEYL